MYQQGYPGYPQSGYPQPPSGYPGQPSGFSQPGQPQPGYPQPGYPGGAPQYYTIISRLHGMVLDVERGVANPGTRVIPWNKHGKDNQLWYDDPSTGTIRTKINGFCLDIEGDQSLRVMPYQPGDPNQQWERDHEGYIRNRVQRNKVLDICSASRDAGAKICMWDANGGLHQQWNFEFVGGQPGYPGGQSYPGSQPYTGSYPGSEPYPASFSQGYPGSYPAPGAVHQRRDFFIVSDMNGHVLDVKGGNANAGAEIIMWNRKQQPSKNQLWYLDQQGFIRSALNDFALEAQNGGKLKLQPFNGNPNQLWVLDGNKITNRGTGNCLDICGANHHAGTEVCSWNFKDSSNQHWHVDYIN